MEGLGLGRRPPLRGKSSRMEDALGQAFKRNRRKGLCPCKDCVTNGKHFTIKVHKMLEVQSLYKPSLPNQQQHQPRAKKPRLRLTSVPLVDLRLSTSGSTKAGSDEEDQASVASCESTTRVHLISKGGLCAVGDCNMETGRPGTASVRIKHLASSYDGEPRFPKLNECAHFHYEFVELGPIRVCLHEETRDSSLKAVTNGSSECEAGSAHGSNAGHLAVQVCSNGKAWCVRRSYENFRLLDRQLHQCIYDRKFSALPELPIDENELCQGSPNKDVLRLILADYLGRFSDIAGNLINCGPVLNWLELDNRGNRLIVTDDSAINTPAVAAAYVVKRYTAKASDELSFEVGDMISVIDMPPPDESIWWRGKRGFEVGFFPSECVEVIGDKVPHLIHIPGAPTKPVLRKHGKLIAFFRSFILSRPSRRKLKQTGILKERVFGCDLGEHLLNSSHEIPTVLKHCADFIEAHGVVDGIYRLSGITSNIQKLRNAFDEDRVPDLNDEAILQDIHCVASLLKMYFRELPNPLLTYQLYDKFVAAVQSEEHLRLFKMRDVVQQLPPPHYRTLEYLIKHLSRVAAHGAETGMTPKNVAIVWAPNLLRFKDLEVGGVAALQEVGVQAIVTEYLIHYAVLIFKEILPEVPSMGSFTGVGSPKRNRPKSLAISTPTKLLSLEEARSRAIGGVPGQSQQRYIEVGGGPSNLPSKYHTVIDLPERHTLRKHGAGSGSVKNKKSPSGWKSFFSKGKSQSARGERDLSKIQRKGSTASVDKRPGSRVSVSSLREKSSSETDGRSNSNIRLRSVKSAESLVSCGPGSSKRNSSIPDTPRGVQNICGVELRVEGNKTAEDSAVPSFVGPACHSSTTPIRPPSSPPTHMRSVSHDSYFEAAIERERERQKNNKRHRELGSIAGDDTDEQDLSPEDDEPDLFGKGRTENITCTEEEEEIHANVSVEFPSFEDELIGNMQKEVEDALAWDVTVQITEHQTLEGTPLYTSEKKTVVAVADVHAPEFPCVSVVGGDVSFSISSDEDCRHIDSSNGIDEDDRDDVGSDQSSRLITVVGDVELVEELDLPNDEDEGPRAISPRLENHAEEMVVVSVLPKEEDGSVLNDADVEEEETDIDQNEQKDDAHEDDEKEGDIGLFSSNVDVLPEGEEMGFSQAELEETVAPPDEGFLRFEAVRVVVVSDDDGRSSSQVEESFDFKEEVAQKSLEDSDSSSSRPPSGSSPSPGDLFNYALLAEEDPDDDGCAVVVVEESSIENASIENSKAVEMDVDEDTRGIKCSPPSTLLLSLSLTPSPVPASLSASPSISPRKLSPFSDRLLSPMDESKRKFESEIGRDILRERRTKLELEKIQGLVAIASPCKEARASSPSPSNSCPASPSSSSSSSSCIVVEVDASGFPGPKTDTPANGFDTFRDADIVKRPHLQDVTLDLTGAGRRSSEPTVTTAKTEDDGDSKRRSEPVPRCLRPAERKASVRELVSKFEVKPKVTCSESPPSTPHVSSGKPPLFPKPRVIKLQSLSPPALHNPMDNPLENVLAAAEQKKVEDEEEKEMLRKRTTSATRSRRRRRTKSYGEDRDTGADTLRDEVGAEIGVASAGSEPCSPMYEMAVGGQQGPLGALVLDQSESARRERIDRYKEERRAQLRQRIHSKQDDKEKRVSIF